MRGVEQPAHATTTRKSSTSKPRSAGQPLEIIKFQKPYKSSSIISLSITELKLSSSSSFKMLNPSAQPFFLNKDKNPNPCLIQTYYSQPPQLHYYHPMIQVSTPFYNRPCTNYQLHLPLLYSSPHLLLSAITTTSTSTASTKTDTDEHKYPKTSFGVNYVSGVVGKGKNTEYSSSDVFSHEYLGSSSTTTFPTKVTPKSYKWLKMKREQRKIKTTTSTVWRPKTTDGKVQSFSPYDFNVVEGKTTVMMKNIPNKICLRNLLKVLDNHCSLENEKTQTQNLSDALSSAISEYDFVYLPMDFRSGFNLGYAFVNFTSGNAAVKFYHCFHKLKWEKIGFPASSKICEISIARIQGKERLVNHFHRSWFKCYTDDYLPTVFNPPRNGVNSTSTLSFVGQRRDPG